MKGVKNARRKLKIFKGAYVSVSLLLSLYREATDPVGHRRQGALPGSGASRESLANLDERCRQPQPGD
jgi:hypothetical protein